MTLVSAIDFHINHRLLPVLDPAYNGSEQKTTLAMLILWCWLSLWSSVAYICFGRAEATTSVQRGRRVFHVPRCVFFVTSWFPNIWGSRERPVTRSFILFTPHPVGSALVLNATWKVSQERSLDAHWLRLSLQRPRSVTDLDDLLDGPKATDLDLQRLLWPVSPSLRPCQTFLQSTSENGSWPSTGLSFRHVPLHLLVWSCHRWCCGG